MKKSYIYTMLLTVGVMLGITACSSDNDWQPGSVSGQQVFFSNELGSKYEISNTESSFTIPVSRQSTSGALSVPLKVTMSAGSIFSLPESVSFADGSNTAELVVSYDPTKIEYGKYDTISVAITDAANASNYGITTYQFTAGITEWVKLSGQGTFRDDLIASLYGIPVETWAVDIYESALAPGRYKITAPYSPAYGFAKSSLWSYDGEILEYYVETGNCDMIIDATDPDYVYFQYFDTGFVGLADAGMLGATSYVWYWLEGGTALEDIKSARPTYFGKLKDGIISFETPKIHLLTMDGELSWYGNTNGMLAIALPGAVFADFSAELTYGGLFTNPEKQVFAIGNLTLGSDVETAKAIVMSASDDAAAIADAIAAGELEAMDVEAGEIRVPIAEDLSGNLQLIVVVLDGTDVKSIATANFEYYSGAEPWASLGIGYYTDDFVVSVFGNDPYTYQIEIEESTETPGIYRMKNAYAPVASAFGVTGGNANVVINATDPNGVYFTKQSIGLDLGYGDMSIESEGGSYIDYYGAQGYSPEIVIKSLPDLFGSLADGVITLPVLPRTDSEGNPVTDEDGNPKYYQGYMYDGQGGYYAGTNGAFKLVLPTAAASAKAKAKRAASASDFERRLNGNMRIKANMKKKTLRMILPKNKITKIIK